MVTMDGNQLLEFTQERAAPPTPRERRWPPSEARGRDVNFRPLGPTAGASGLGPCSLFPTLLSAAGIGGRYSDEIISFFLSDDFALIILFSNNFFFLPTMKSTNQ
jgi:hypothetical protein